MSLSPFQMAAQARVAGGRMPTPSSMMQPPTSPAGQPPGDQDAMQGDLNQVAANALAEANDALLQMVNTGQPPDESILGPELQSLGQTIQLLQAHAQSQAAPAPGMGGQNNMPGGAPPMGPGGY